MVFWYIYNIEDYEMSKKYTKIITLFKAYTAKDINEKQFSELQHWIHESPENNQLFSSYLLFHKRSRRIAFYESLDQGKAWDKIVSQLEQPFVKPVRKEKRIRKVFWKYAAAAIVIATISTTFFLKESIFNNHINDFKNVDAQIQSGTDKAILTLDTGEEIALVKGTLVKTKNATSNGKEIIYDTTAKTQQPKVNNNIANNYLTVPRGGQYQITLADGTEVWLNSESQLKYPVSFQKGEVRKVELVYGEAYFEVSPSTNHNGATFQVINKGQNVEVVGTAFNIKAYKNETKIYTTLIEGKVSVSYNNSIKEYLSPNKQAIYNLNDHTFKINTIEVYNEIAWKEGIFSFENKTLKEMMVVLTRWYDIEVDIQNMKAAEEEFIGSLSKNQSMNEILEIIKNFGIIKEYKVEPKKITIN